MIVKDIELVTFTKDLQTHDFSKEEETNFSVKHKSYNQEACLFCELRNEENNNCRPELKFRKALKAERVSDKVKSKAMMTLNRSVSSFTSYIDTGDNDDHEDDADSITPSLLDGEIVVTSGDRVALYSSSSSGCKEGAGSFVRIMSSGQRSIRSKLSPRLNHRRRVSELTSGQTGVMFVTTLKVSFEQHLQNGNESSKRENKLLKETDIPLSSIETVYEIYGEHADKKRKLSIGSSHHSKIDGILIICKNFKVYKFNFKFAKVDVGRKMTNAILHHARPSSSELLFGYEHSLGHETARPRFSWDNVVKESGVDNVRVSRANDTWQVSATLPRQFPVPAHVTDATLTRVADTCVGNRPPVWVWGTRSGGSLFIQPQFSVSQSDKLDSLIQDFFKTKSLVTIDTDYYLPKLSSVEDSYQAMIDLHCVDGDKEMEEKDKSYLSSLESAGWLSTIGSALNLASQVAEEVVRGKTVLVRDGDGRSYSILVSSLAMVLLSEEFRTREGVEQIIEANWVSLGYPFNKNHCLTSPVSSKQSGKLSPLFLVFLDCLHQLCHQFPSKFQFLPSFLVTCWDTCLLPVSQTFLFDCEHDQEVARASARSQVAQVSALQWSTQFTPEQISAWDNPLYGVPMRPARGQQHDTQLHSMIMSRQVPPLLPEARKVLPVSGDMINLQIWHQLFHRMNSSLRLDTAWEGKMTEVQNQAKLEIMDIANSTNPGNGMVRRQNNHKK